MPWTLSPVSLSLAVCLSSSTSSTNCTALEGRAEALITHASKVLKGMPGADAVAALRGELDAFGNWRSPADRIADDVDEAADVIDAAALASVRLRRNCPDSHSVAARLENAAAILERAARAAQAEAHHSFSDQRK